MEDEGSKTKLIIGIVAVVILLIVGFVFLRNVARRATFPSQIPQAVVTPTPFLNGNEQISTAPSISPSRTGGYYYQQGQPGSQAQSSSQSQNQSGNSQLQSQTLPDGTTQSQSQ